jgi:hypothetical protein
MRAGGSCAPRSALGDSGTACGSLLPHLPVHAHLWFTQSLRTRCALLPGGGSLLNKQYVHIHVVTSVNFVAAGGDALHVLPTRIARGSVDGLFVNHPEPPHQVSSLPAVRCTARAAAGRRVSRKLTKLCCLPITHRDVSVRCWRGCHARAAHADTGLFCSRISRPAARRATDSLDRQRKLRCA